jgi:hypothetical protein
MMIQLINGPVWANQNSYDDNRLHFVALVNPHGNGNDYPYQNR